MAQERIPVTAYSGYRGEETPREFILHGDKVKVTEILNAWIEKGAEDMSIKRFFKVRGSDGSAHKLDYDEDKKEWSYDVNIKKIRTRRG